MLNLSAPTWELEQDITLNSYIGWVGGLFSPTCLGWVLEQDDGG